MQQRAEVFADNTTPGLESCHTSLSVASPVLTSSPVLQAHTPPPPALPTSDIKASGTPVRFSSLTPVISMKPKKSDHSSGSAPDDQCDKRGHTGIKKEPIDNGGYKSNVNAGSAPLVSKHDTAPIEGGREKEPLANIRDAEHDKHDPAHKHINVNSGCSLQHVQPKCGNRVEPKTRSSKIAPAASHSPNQP